MYQIVNANIITPFEERAGAVLINGPVFGDILESPARGVEAIDARGLYMAPGFVDIHAHGGGGVSAMSGEYADIIKMADAHARFGTTSILPTTLAAPAPAIKRALAAIEAARAQDARILGAHMEGPCLSPAQAGAQAPGALMSPADFDIDEYARICPGIRVVGAAPELEGGLELGDKLNARGIVASIAHSDAEFDTVKRAICHGYSDITHLYSCCSSLKRVNGFRVPGVVEAGLILDELSVQVIADGKHLPPQILSLIYRCRGAEDVILVTDALEFAGAALEEGREYTQLNGVKAVYEDGVMKLPDRQAFAGSVATMNALVRTMAGAGVKLKDAVRMATENPARRVGASGIGRIQKGYRADFVLFDTDVNVSMVATAGVIERELREGADD